MANRRTIGTGAAIALVLVGAIMLAYELWPVSHTSGTATGSFYSDDDGRSYFSDTIYKFPPFDHNGKTAYRARVYQSGRGKFVAYLERYNAEANKALDDAYAKSQAGQIPLTDVAVMISNREFSGQGIEQKLPGSGNDWVPRGQLPKGSVKSPDGGDFWPVLP